jgi:hypothetical protein
MAAWCSIEFNIVLVHLAMGGSANSRIDLQTSLFKALLSLQLPVLLLQPCGL